MFEFYSWNQFNSYNRTKDINTHKLVITWENTLGVSINDRRMTAGGHTAVNVLKALKIKILNNKY